jgi:hypothetical protein
MGKITRKPHPQPSRTRKPWRKLKFRKGTDAERSELLARFASVVKGLKDVPPCNAVEMVREQRDKDYYHN